MLKVEVHLVDEVDKSLQLEMLASKMPRLMYPPTKLLISNIDPNVQYKMYLQLGKLVPRYQLEKGTWKPARENGAFDHSGQVELKRVLSREGQQSGRYFMENGISFNHVCLSFDRRIAESRADTLYVKQNFKYIQMLIIDRVSHGNHTIRRHSLFGNSFIAVNKIMSPRMVEFYSQRFEALRQGHHRQDDDVVVEDRPHQFVAPRVVTGSFPLPPHPDPKLGFISLHINDPGDYSPQWLPDGSVLVRSFGTTYYYPAEV